MIRVYVEKESLSDDVRTRLTHHTPGFASIDQKGLWLNLHTDEEGIWFEIDKSNPVIPEIAKDLKIRGVSAWVELWSARRECGVYRIDTAVAELTTEPIGCSLDDFQPIGVDADHFHYSLKTRGIVSSVAFRQILDGVRDGSLSPETSWDKPVSPQAIRIHVAHLDHEEYAARLDVKGAKLGSGKTPTEALGRLLEFNATRFGVTIEYPR